LTSPRSHVGRFWAAGRRWKRLPRSARQGIYPARNALGRSGSTGAARLAHRRPVSTYNVLGRQPTPQSAQAQPSRHPTPRARTARILPRRLHRGDHAGTWLLGRADGRSRARRARDGESRARGRRAHDRGRAHEDHGGGAAGARPGAHVLSGWQRIGVVISTEETRNAMPVQIQRVRTWLEARSPWSRVGSQQSSLFALCFSILKRGINGTYHHVSQQHLKRYLAEFDFRYNARSALGVEDTERTTRVLSGIVGKRLIYRESFA
jgi:hypothetical protein